MVDGGGGGYTSVFNFSMKMGSASGPHGNLPPPWIGTLSIHQFFNKDEEGGGVRGGLWRRYTCQYSLFKSRHTRDQIFHLTPTPRIKCDKLNYIYPPLHSQWAVIT